MIYQCLCSQPVQAASELRLPEKKSALENIALFVCSQVHPYATAWVSWMELCIACAIMAIKRFTPLNFQSVVTPNGLTVNL